MEEEQGQEEDCGGTMHTAAAEGQTHFRSSLLLSSGGSRVVQDPIAKRINGQS